MAFIILKLLANIKYKPRPLQRFYHEHQFIFMTAFHEVIVYKHNIFSSFVIKRTWYRQMDILIKAIWGIIPFVHTLDVISYGNRH